MPHIAGHAPPVGLIGSEQALRQGQTGAEAALRGGLRGGLSALDVGNEGLDIQAALAGLRGGPAQATAFQNFQQSPGQQFLREQGEQTILRNQAAIGGLGGGNVRRALTEFGIGTAAQDFGNQFQRGQQVIGSQQALAPTAANLISGTGQNIAQSRLGTGQNLAGGRFQTGSALSNLLSQQGGGAADIIGTGSANIAQLLQGFGGQQAGSNQALATLLANLAAQQGTAAAGQPSAAQFLQNTGSLGDIAQLASGIGGAAAGASDIRLKKNIEKIGVLPNGLNIYKWDWKEEAALVSGPKMTIGVIAQEVQEIMPNAVILDSSGYLKVNYGMVLNG